MHAFNIRDNFVSFCQRFCSLFSQKYYYCGPMPKPKTAGASKMIPMPSKLLLPSLNPRLYTTVTEDLHGGCSVIAIADKNLLVVVLSVHLYCKSFSSSVLFPKMQECVLRQGNKQESYGSIEDCLLKLDALSATTGSDDNVLV